jgi:putative SOS response-associated peptidase YedK
MSERYTFFTPKQVIEDELGLLILTDISPRYNIAPGQAAPVVTQEIPRQEQFMTWGHLPKAKRGAEPPSPIIHTMAESVQSHFPDAFHERRCIVLSDGFFVWKFTAAGRQPIHVRFHDHRLMTFAGIWWEADQNNLNRSFCILSSASNENIRKMDLRMPAILPDFASRELWLHPEAEHTALHELLKPLPDTGLLEVAEVSFLVNDPRNQGPEVLGPSLAKPA